MTEEKITETAADGMLKLLFANSLVRGEVVNAAEGWVDMTQYHQYPENVARMLGEFTAGAMLLAGTIKFDGALILQIKGSGPVSLAVVEVQNDLTVRAMAKVREGAEVTAEMGMQELINAGGLGQCTIILDPHDRAPGVMPYQGVVALNGDTVASVLEGYMMQSEQLDTRLWLAADDKRVGGLLLQKMPSIGGSSAEVNETETWNELVTLGGTVKSEELLTLDRQTLTHRLFWQQSLQVAEDRPVSFRCNCSREKTDSMLHSLGKAELDEIFKTRDNVEVTCQFCNRKQSYSKGDIEALFVEEVEEAVTVSDPKTVH